MFKRLREKRFEEEVRKMRAEKDAACARGEHVPCWYQEENGPGKYFCQECLKEMTREEWVAYFSTPEMQVWRETRKAILGY